jgi:hypothetical protein
MDAKIYKSDHEELLERWETASRKITAALRSGDTNNLDEFAWSYAFLKSIQNLDEEFKICSPFITGEIINIYTNNLFSHYPEKVHQIIMTEISHLVHYKYRHKYKESNQTIIAEKLSDIWIDDSFQTCISILKTPYKKIGIPAIIDDKGDYIGGKGKNKGILIAWFMAMKKNDKLLSIDINQEKMRDLILAQFPGLKTLSVRTLDKSKAEVQYDFTINHFSDLV